MNACHWTSPFQTSEPTHAGPGSSCSQLIFAVLFFLGIIYPACEPLPAQICKQWSSCGVFLHCDMDCCPVVLADACLCLLVSRAVRHSLQSDWRSQATRNIVQQIVPDWNPVTEFRDFWQGCYQVDPWATQYYLVWIGIKHAKTVKSMNFRGRSPESASGTFFEL